MPVLLSFHTCQNSDLPFAPHLYLGWRNWREGNRNQVAEPFPCWKWASHKWIIVIVQFESFKIFSISLLNIFILSFSFMNIWNTVIVTLLFSLSSILSVTSGPALTAWFFCSFWVVFSCNCMLLMPGIMNFTLLGTEYFYLSLTILELWDMIKLVGHSLIFLSLVFYIC